MLSSMMQTPLMARGPIPLHPESQEAVGRRLEAFRKAIGARQEELTKLLGGERNSLWANYEAGERRISLDRALILCREFGLTLEWIYRGHKHYLPDELREKIRVQELLAERKAKS